MKKLLLIMMALFLWTGVTWGQAASYVFSSTSGTYTAINGGTILKDGTTAMDSWASAAITIPSFTFSGVAYTTAYITSNGFITLGGTAPSAFTSTAISSTTGSGIAICPFSADLDRATTTSATEIRWETVGNEVVFQWSQIKRYGSTESFDMQARLNTSNGVIKFVYNLNSGPGTSTSYQPQVGLRTSSSDYTNRLVASGTENWNTSLPGTSNTSTCRFTSSPPAKNFSSGLTYTWTPASCAPPSALLVTNLTTTTATIGWTAPASAPSGGYQWEVRTSGAGGSGNTGLADSGSTGAGVTTDNVTGLTSGTNYNLYVRSNCGVGDYSSWVNTTFSTLLCDPANQCAYTVNLTDAYNDGWDGTVLGFKQNGIIVATFGNGFTSGGTFGPVVANLCDALPTQIVVVTLGSYVGEKGFIVYDPFGVEIFRWNSGGVFTISTIFHTFTSNCTPPACDAPTNLQVSNQTQNSAQLSWTPGSTETEWRIEWGIAGFNQGEGTTINNVTNNSYTLTGLTQATHYQYYVSGNCETRAYSNWSGPFTFSTLSSPITSFPFFEGFEVVYFPPAGWQSKDEDGDGFNWLRLSTLDLFSSRTGTGSAGSASYDNPTITALTPDNWLISPPIAIPATGEFVLDYYVAAQDVNFPSEKYGVYISTTGTDPASFTQAFVETLSSTTYALRTINLFAYNGQNIYLAWRHFDCTDMFFMKIDDVTIRMLPPPCPTPINQPTALILTPASTSISGSYTAASGATGHLVLRSTSPTLDALPQNKTNYSSGNTLGNATVVYAGTNTTTFNTTGLTAFTPYYFFVFAYNSGADCAGPVYRTVSPLTGSTTTLPAAPASFVASPLSPNQIGFTATANSLGHNIMIAYSTESSTAFGTPTTMYPIGSTIPGGGVVHYVGPANEVYNHNNLSENTTYYYRAWTIVPGPIYSSTSLLSTAKTPCSPFTQLPWNEGFENVDLGSSTSSTTLFPSCWTKQNGDWATAKNSSSSSDADARSGAQFLRNSWSATNEFMWTPGFALQSGMSYDFSFWWAGDNYAGWTGDVFYNSTPNGTGATQLGASFVTPATTTTKNYAKVTRTFAPTTDGTYYFAIRINATSVPYYLSFDDFELRVTPTAPIFVITPQQADFGSQSIFSPSVPQAFTFYNDGIGTITISSIALGGTDANQFVLHTFQPMPIVLGPSQVATVSVTFAPVTAGSKTAQLVFTDNLSSKVVRSLPLTGVGVDPTITSIPYIESFDETTFAPIGWTNTLTAIGTGSGSSGIWERTTAGSSPVTSPKSGAAMAQFRSFSFAAGTKAELITPPINLPAGNFRVSFWMNRDAGYPTTADKVNVYFNTTNSIIDATLLGTVHRSMSLEPVALTAGWYAYSFYLPENATGNGRYIILEGISAYGNNIFIDDFSISSPMVVSHTASNLSCFESNDGSIALNIQGGIPPLTITWKKDNELLESTSTLLEQLPAALYEYTVKEATGISVTELVTLTQPAAIPVATVTNTTVVYDGTAKTINAVAPAGTSLVWYTQAEGGSPVPAPAKIEAGTYNYWVAAKSNLTTCESQRIGAVLTINKKSLTVKADDKSKCQNADLPLLTITYTGFVPNEGPAQLTVLPVATTTALPSSPIGTYPITVGGGVSNNYSFVYQSGTLTVVRTPMVNAGGPGFVCVSEVFPIVAATATNYTSLVWSTSGNGTFSNANILNPVYTPGSLDIANGSATLTLTADPGSYCSDVDQMILSIQNDLPVSVTITQDDTEICLAEPVTFTATPINGGLTPSFQWKVNGQNAGTNNSTFTYLPSDGDVVTVLHTTSISCALNNTALSNAITVDVTPDLTAGVSISTPSNAVCDFTPTTFNAIPSNGGVSPSYQWKVNGENMGTNAAEFTYIPLNGDEVSVVMTSSHSCAVVPVAISNSIDMSVAPPFLELAANPTKGGTVSGGGNYADGTEVTITATAATGWEFLNWRDMSGTIVSTEAVTVHTIHECYEKLTATFSSTAKIVGQLKYFNEDETIIPSPNNHGVFYVQLFENGVAISPRQLVTHNLEVGLDSYYEFTGVESGKDYSVRIWEESTINTLANTWSWNNWGGATSSDAFIISWMANMNPELTYFPWIWPGGASELTPYSLELADVNNNQMIANSDALMVVYRLLGQPEFSPFPGGVQNFILATTKVADHQTKAHPNAPEKLFTQFGDYNASMPAPSVYQEVLLTNLSDGTNVYNIYFVATGDLNTSYTPGSVNRNLALLEYNGIINASKGDEILIPVRLGETADLGSITLGLNYNNKVIEVLDVIGYDLYSIDHANGTVKIAWYDMNSKVFANDQHLVLLQAKLTGDISAGTRYLELLPVTELADGNALQLQNVTLRTDYIETSSGIINNPELLSISHSIYPNPFNGIATMRYTLPEAGKFMLTIYNHLGQEITTVVEENQQAGAHELKINGTLFINSGRYYYHLKLDGVNNTYQARGTVVFTK